MACAVISRSNKEKNIMAKLFKMRRPQKPCFQAALQNDGTLELLVYDQVGFDWWSGGGITAKSFKDQIDAAGNFERILVRINSPGGDPFEGSAIYSLIRAQKKPVEVCVDGIAASAASIIAMAGDTVTMGPGAMMMIHNASGYCMGFAADMRKMADALDAISGSIAQVYVTRTKQTLDKITAMMDAETWMTAQECVDQGFATAIVAEPEIEQNAMALARNFTAALASMKNVPAALKAKPEPPAAPAAKVRNAAAGACECDCDNCRADDCDECTNVDCDDPNCTDCPQQVEAKARASQAAADNLADLDRAKARLALRKMAAASR
jgi:ATP-dependent Clp protease protease subunit